MKTSTGRHPGVRVRIWMTGAGAALLSMLSAGAAIATEPQVAPPTGTPAVTTDARNTPAPQVDGLGAAVDAEALLALRGGDDTQSQTILVDGTVGDNSAENIVSGHNVVSDGSFGNAAGIATVIQNSGSNVLIQNAMNVNVDFVDPSP